VKKISSLVLVVTLSAGASSLVAGVANINFGSANALGGSQFFGADATAADSIAIGFFAGNTVNTDLTGWTAFATDSVFETSGFNSASAASVDTTAADGLDAYLLITDGSLSALVRLNSWAAYTGTVPPAAPSQLAFQFGSGDTSANVLTFAAAGTVVSVTDGQGTNFSGGFSGNGISVSLSVVPEPSSYAALAGLCALGAVLVRRRRT
jgi:hypothetical protein